MIRATVGSSVCPMPAAARDPSPHRRFTVENKQWGGDQGREARAGRELLNRDERRQAQINDSADRGRRECECNRYADDGEDGEYAEQNGGRQFSALRTRWEIGNCERRSSTPTAAPNIIATLMSSKATGSVQLGEPFKTIHGATHVLRRVEHIGERHHLRRRNGLLSEAKLMRVMPKRARSTVSFSRPS
jgi:hypothetical protein